MKTSLIQQLKKMALVLLACTALYACSDRNKFEISGKFSNAKPQTKVYLYGINRANETALDSTVLSEKGEFKFSHETPDVDFFRVKIDHNEYMLIAKNGDRIDLEADLNDETMAYKLSGADEADKLEELNKNKNAYIAKNAAIEAQFQENVAKEPQSRQAIINQMTPAMLKAKEDLVNYILKFAMDNTSSLAGFYAINSLNPSDYETELLAYADKIKSNFNKNEAVTDFLVRMAKLKSVQVGQLAPDFTMNTIDGKPITLSSLRGKYVMIDFWASWCVPCREENPNIVAMYKKYKDKNFTILGVSLDKDPVAWKQAIVQDGLSWTHASELKDFESPTVRAYQVDGIPANFILDPQGKIVGKNLRGADLDIFLNKTLR